MLIGETDVTAGAECMLTKLSTGEKYHILQELTVVAIVVAIFIVAVVIHYFRPAFGITDILVILAVGMIFGVVIQRITQRILGKKPQH